MNIACLKESKNNEYRVGLTPREVEILIEKKHKVFIENNAGVGSGFSNQDFIDAGAKIFTPYNRECDSGLFYSPYWRIFDVIVKVKEPLQYELIAANNAIFFAFFHLPANEGIKKIIVKDKIRIVPYENIQLPDGSRPILAAMSKVAGEVSVDAAAHYLRKENDGKGILLRDANTIVIGCKGIVGKTAFDILAKRGANVIGFDREEKIGRQYTCHKTGRQIVAERVFSKKQVLKILSKSDLMICAAAQRGEGAPKLVTREMLRAMQPGSVIVDTAIDEGGCCETSRPTTHANPVYVEKGIIHYCVANMPGVVPRSSTPALVKKVFPYLLEVAEKGWEKALKENPILKNAAKIN